MAFCPAIGTNSSPAPLHVAPSRRCILPLLPSAVRLQCGTGKAQRRAVEGGGGSTANTCPHGPSLGVLRLVALLAPGPAGDARGPPFSGLPGSASGTQPRFEPCLTLALAADPGRPPARLRRSPPVSKTGLPAGMVSRPGRRPQVLAAFMAVLPPGGRWPPSATTAGIARGPGRHLPAVVPPSGLAGTVGVAPGFSPGLQPGVPLPVPHPFPFGTGLAVGAAGRRGDSATPQAKACGSPLCHAFPEPFS